MKRCLVVFISILLTIFATLTSNAQTQQKKAAIIIDDFGGGIGGVKEFLEGDVPITVAVMPFTETSKEHAEWAHKNGFEVMVHLPMQPKKGKMSWLGPKPITADLPLEEVRKRVTEAIDSVPYALGLNNHMGSLVVEKEDIVRVIVEVAKEKRLYIVDSATSSKSKFPKVAKELGVPIIKRDVFLDDVASIPHVKKQMSLLAKITEQEGTGVAIGHVGVTGKVCSTGIFESAKELEKRKITIVPVSDILSNEIKIKYLQLY
ncbi:divergent polysaccharide deacetylase family protein [Bacillus sp. 31A1R]|uniref:Divergent polysaccharide deacetylase family protein n=1 Tax=Robertmurraya mangrovi TaxID=3098077 RepID=A0ABU5IWP2_9BACI|nr:divergent polysaccharide deacetylase family protein [Bacillus sp. 31A1R]MDZ5471572.1 divergent polysaccharide deacetylase family protein [Bacillus sp. 31A1R]